MITDFEIKDSYAEDTSGRKYHTPTMSSKSIPYKIEKAKTTASFNLNKPMSYEEFLKLSDDSQRMYLKYLHDNFKVNGSDIMEMFKIGRTTLCVKIIGRLKLQGMFERGKKMPYELIPKWKAFLKDEGCKEVDSDKAIVVQSEPKPIEQNKTPTQATFTLDTISTSICMKGKMNSSEIARRLQAIIPDGVECSIAININRVGEGDIIDY